MWNTWVWSLGWEDPLEKGKATHSSILVQRIPWTIKYLLVELFQILKDAAVKVLHSICQQIWKTQQWPQEWKRSVFIPILEKGNVKECPNYHTIALTLKILQARLQRYMNHELSDVQAGFRKGRGTRDQIANICWIIEKAREFQKNTYFCFIDYAKDFDSVDHNKLWPVSWEICMQVRKQELELDVEQQTGSKLGKEYVKAVYCYPAYLTYMQKHWAEWSTSWNQDFQEKYQ